MKILFLMLHPGYIRNYESVIRALTARGHKVQLHFNLVHKQAEDMLAERLSADDPNVTYSRKALPKRIDKWAPFTRVVRGGIDYARYYHPKYKDAVKLRERIEVRPEGKLWKPIFKLYFALRGGAGLQPMYRFLDMLEGFIPTDRRIDTFMQDQNADMVFITPLVNFTSEQAEYLKSAKRLGLKCVLCVASWDNLTNKGGIRMVPDKVIVWNEFQRAEAAEFHGIPPEKVVVTGAQCYDKWFDQKPTMSQTEFCARVGLRADLPYVLYICSSPFIAKEEVAFVDGWIRAIRSHADPAVRRLGILVRPHPQNAAQWKDVDFSAHGNVSIHPRLGANPVTTESRGDFFNSIYYSAGVVGINSSSMIESGVLDKPVYTLLAPGFEGTQKGTLHFHYLVEGGLMKIGADMQEHLAHLAEGLKESDGQAARRREFVKNFTRPHGLKTPCTPIFADAIEAFAKETLEAPKPVTWVQNAASRLLSPPLAAYTALFRSQGATPGAAAGGFALRLVKYSAGLVAGAAWKALKLVGIGGLIKRQAMPFIAERVRAYNASLEIDPAIQCRKVIDAIAEDNKPVIVGPWVSEVGFETLYWVPFVKWILEKAGVSRERVIVVSRGGAQPWYGHIADKYVDAFDFYSQEEFKQKNMLRIQDTGGQKHTSVNAFDNEIVAHVKRSTGIGDFHWVHPMLMYNLFRPFWMRQQPVSLVERYTIFRQFQDLDLDGLRGRLPEDYVAVKFYFSECFPDTPENQAHIREILRGLARNNHVVLLNTGLDIDDHSDSMKGDMERIHNVESFMTPRNNLAVQTQIISRAKAFYGTYGGFSYLAPFYGVPSLAFFSREDKFLPVHLDVAHRAFRSLKFGRFDKTRELPAELQARGRPEFMTFNLSNLDMLKTLFNGGVADDRVIRTAR